MIKGVHIDFRSQKLRPDAMIDVLRDIKAWGYNAILLEYMDAFPFEGRLKCLSAPDAFTREELERVLAEARKLEIEIIPLVQSFGHLYWVLRHPEFMHLAEGYREGMKEEDAAWESGCMRLHTICPSNDEAYELFCEIASQIRSYHTDSRYFHIGGDEIRKPSCPRCEKRLETMSLPDLLAGHYGRCADHILSLGAKPIVYCDILLAHPDTLDILKDKVAVMDWDYWSDGKPSEKGHLWGLNEYIHEPDKWPETQQKLFRPYFYYHEPDLINAFPFTNLLRDKGFDVILASAARTSGDSFCVPMENHINNVSATVTKAEKSGISGFVVTSWAARRSPWPMTEYTLMRGAEFIGGKEEIDEGKVKRAFAKRHFGVEDELLGELPILLGEASRLAGNPGAILHSLNEHSDRETGHLLAPEYDQSDLGRSPRIQRVMENKEAFLESWDVLRKAIVEAEKRLEKAAPNGRYVPMWRWAIDVFKLYCDAAPYIAEEEISDVDAVNEIISRAEAMKPITKELLMPIYTEFTMVGELQCRFGVLIHHFKRKLGLPYDRLD